MGLVKDALSKSIDFVREEIIPLRADLIKAGILNPEQTAYDQKASLVDPWSYANTAYGYKEKYSLLDYQKCRQITYADPIVAAVIQTRLNQAAAFARPQSDKYKMGFKIKMRDNEKKPSAGDKKRIKELETFVSHCGVPENFEDTPEVKRRDSFETFLRKIVRDSLTFDQLNFEVVPRKDGKPYAFQAVDAATIRVIPDLKENVEKFGAGGGNQSNNEVNVMPFSDESKHFKMFKPKHPRYAQVISGTVRHVFDEWELAFGVRNPRTDIASYGYGYSEIEMLVTTITSHMNAETYNRKFFSQGSSVKGIITFEGAVPPDQLEGFRRQWYQQVTGVNNAWRTPIMALGKDTKLNWTNLHSTNREMEFGKWLEYCIKTICGVFQMDPIEIGFDITKNGSGQSGGSAGLGQGNQAERMAFSQDKGLRPLLIFVQSLINDYIVYRIDPNYEFEFVGLNVNSEKDDLDSAIQQGKAFKTINEIRAEHDLKPLGDDIKNPGDLILDSSLIQFITSQQQAAQGGEGGEMGPDGLPVNPDDQGGEQKPGAEGKKGEGDDQAAGGESEPDYENMSTEELEKELSKLQGSPDQQNPQAQGKPIQPSAPANPKNAKKIVKASMWKAIKELEL
jgi:hypothetical protein